MNKQCDNVKNDVNYDSQNNNYILRQNQLKAIQTSIDNDFQSGIHYHATGTGKSWIAMYLVEAYNRLYPKNNIIWICEQKSILIEQFQKNTMKERNFQTVLKPFNVLNYSEYKLGTWHESVNSGRFWGKPVLLIINRTFLTCADKYKLIKSPFHLIIHDECHTIVNQSTQEFYKYVLSNPLFSGIKCIGFSATPNTNYEPFTKIITSYSIYDAFQENVIVPPKIKWFNCHEPLTQEHIVKTIKELVIECPYKKIVVWCGMIDLCNEMAVLWQQFFPDFLICIDTSKTNQSSLTEENGYNQFESISEKAILFCACKHREGSDIKNLDTCVFLDKVESRSAKTFIQCIGRTLRVDKDLKKRFGLIIDVRAKNSFYICSNVNKYLNLNLDESIFPWDYSYDVLPIDDRVIKVNTLLMTDYRKRKNIIKPMFFEEKKTYSPDDVKALFVRQVPDLDVYKERVEYELNMIHGKNLIHHLMQALEVLKITEKIPHVTRGSCGSSLVCYLLGISHVDPVEHRLKFSRFLNKFRNNLPDIDLDFPHNFRDEVFLQLELIWSGKIARISNHVYYHEKSAVRQAIRNSGVRRFIGKHMLDKEVSQMPMEQQKFIREETKRLDNTFKCYSLHCGGIVYFPGGIPKDLVLNAKKTKIINQVNLNKDNVAKDKNFKIDILSSRAISQIFEINRFRKEKINFEDMTYDEQTYKLLCSGKNIGLTLAESPLIRKAFIKIQPKNIFDIAVCLAIIRPAAMDTRNVENIIHYDDHLIFDDDAIDIIAKAFKVDDEEADRLRRGFVKRDKAIMADFKKHVQKLPKLQQIAITTKLKHIAKYSFCKSHAVSYAQLVYRLAYDKCHHPYEFWKAALNNCQSSYRKWVHLYEARCAGVDIHNETLKRDDVSIYAQNRRKKMKNMNAHDELRNFGYWTMKNELFFPGCYFRKFGNQCNFRGIIASHRFLKSQFTDSKERRRRHQAQTMNQFKPWRDEPKKLVVFLGIEKNVYIECLIENVRYFDSKKIGLHGVGIFETPKDIKFRTLKVISHCFF